MRLGLQIQERVSNGTSLTNTTSEKYTVVTVTRPCHSPCPSNEMSVSRVIFYALHCFYSHKDQEALMATKQPSLYSPRPGWLRRLRWGEPGWGFCGGGRVVVLCTAGCPAAGGSEDHGNYSSAPRKHQLHRQSVENHHEWEQVDRFCWISLKGGLYF